MNEIYHEALKLLRRRDYSAARLRTKLADKFGEVPREVMERLADQRFLDDRRVAENIVARRPGSHPDRLRAELAEAGIPSVLIEEVVDRVLASEDRPSLHDLVKAKMSDWHLRPPLQIREAARLYRAMSRLGYPSEEIREELEHLHEQQ